MASLVSQRSVRDAQHGSVLVWALLLVVLTSGMVLSHTTHLRSVRSRQTTRHNRDTLGVTVARSGMTDAIGWFRRQVQQPVRQFSPDLDPDGNPPCHDTIDPALGLVREFQIHGNLWGRYEVRRDQAEDISGEIGVSTPGSAWRLTVRSHIFRLRDDGRPFNEDPNQSVVSLNTRGEIRAVPLTLPAPSAINIEDPAKLKAGPNTVIDGGAMPAISFAKQTDALPVMAIDATAQVSGMPVQSEVPSFDASDANVFGMTLGDLRAFADELVRDSGFHSADEPVRAKNAILFSPTDFKLPRGSRLDNVLLVVNGDLIVPTQGSSQADDKGPGLMTIGAIKAGVVLQRTWNSKSPAIVFELDELLDELEKMERALRENPPDYAERDRHVPHALEDIDQMEDAGLKSSWLDTWREMLQSSDDDDDDDDNSTAEPLIHGVVYVTGNATLEGKVTIHGSIVARGKLTLGTKELVTIRYDTSAVRRLVDNLGQYRERRSASPR